eukprot:1145816-Amorphochlora_amoeboformis.AAC.1
MYTHTNKRETRTTPTGSTAWEYVHGGLDQRPGHARWCRYLEHFHHRSLMRAENGIFLTLKAIRNQSTRLGSGKLRVLPSVYLNPKANHTSTLKLIIPNPKAINISNPKTNNTSTLKLLKSQP